MKKFYLFFLFVLMSSAVMAYEMKCPADINTITDPGVCSDLVSVPRPILFAVLNTQPLGLYYELSGATTGTGMYPATGPALIQFGKGVTTVKLIQKYRDWISFFWFYYFAECSFTVTVTDPEKPKIQCPPDMEKTTDLNLCTYKVSGTGFDPAFQDNCPGSSIKNNFNNLSSLNNAVFPKGNTTVVWTVTDASGNTATCSFVVKVIDKQDPTISCPGDIGKKNDTGKCGAIVTYTVTYSDNCPNSVLTQTSGLPSGAEFPVGVTTNCFKVTDGAGLTATCCFKVTVEDNENPKIVCPGNMKVGTDPGKCSAIVNYTVNYSDNCPGVQLAQTAGLPSGAVFPKGTTTNSFKVTDSKGFTATCSFTVTVEDNEPPVIQACGHTIKVILEKTGFFKWYGVLPATMINRSVSDNCSVLCDNSNDNNLQDAPAQAVLIRPSDGCIMIQYSRTQFYVPGCYYVTVKATDASGNSSTCILKVEAIYPMLKSGEIGAVNNLITDVDIYPNPTNGRFSLDIKNLKNQEVIVKIYNMAGSMVMDRVISTEGHIDLDMTGKTSGVYLMRIIADKQEFIERFVLKDER